MDGEVDGLVTSSKRGGGGREINPPAYTCILPVRPSLLIQVEEDPRLTTPVQDVVLQLARTAEGLTWSLEWSRGTVLKKGDRALIADGGGMGKIEVWEEGAGCERTELGVGGRSWVW